MLFLLEIIWNVECFTSILSLMFLNISHAILHKLLYLTLMQIREEETHVNFHLHIMLFSLSQLSLKHISFPKRYQHCHIYISIPVGTKIPVTLTRYTLEILAFFCYKKKNLYKGSQTFPAFGNRRESLDLSAGETYL